MKTLQTQIGGNHYKERKIQPIEYILANELDFIEGSVVKYITRWKSKNGIEDLQKIIQYCEILIESQETDIEDPTKPLTMPQTLGDTCVPIYDHTAIQGRFDSLFENL